ncbi:MAG: YheT family hydrolase [Archangium sp.]
MPTLVDDFRPAPGLSHTHVQSLFGVMGRPKFALPIRRERRDTPDGDFVDLDIVDGDAGKPTVVLLHGLEGSSASGYMQLMLRGIHQRRWTGIALNARACSGETNRQAASYSSGDFRDLSWLVKSLEGPLFAVGFSLGASVLLNFLAKDPAAVRLKAAVAVSAPYDLALGAKFLDSNSFIARRYLAHFLPTMKLKALEKARTFPSQFDVPAINATTGIRDFDHIVTARLFGFSSAEDYYAQCSAGPQLANIKTRTLLLSAADDAIAPPRLPPDVTNNPNLDVLLTKKGGHVGFVGGHAWKPSFWAEETALKWLDKAV